VLQLRLQPAQVGAGVRRPRLQRAALPLHRRQRRNGLLPARSRRRRRRCVPVYLPLQLVDLRLQALLHLRGR
jgi:hypothetical protein